MNERERFEKLFETKPLDEEYEDNLFLVIAWAAWQAARRWIPVEEEKIPIHEFVNCGLWVDDTENDYSYFDTYYISFDEDFEPRDKWGNYLSEWEYDDFTHWQPLPEPSEE